MKSQMFVLFIQQGMPVLLKSLSECSTLKSEGKKQECIQRTIFTDLRTQSAILLTNMVLNLLTEGNTL
jgi:hypothetical protein